MKDDIKGREKKDHPAEDHGGEKIAYASPSPGFKVSNGRPNLSVREKGRNCR
jgi:hypothetical protein